MGAPGIILLFVFPAFLFFILPDFVRLRRPLEVPPSPTDSVETNRLIEAVACSKVRGLEGLCVLDKVD